MPEEYICWYCGDTIELKKEPKERDFCEECKEPICTGQPFPAESFLPDHVSWRTAQKNARTAETVRANIRFGCAISPRKQPGSDSPDRIRSDLPRPRACTSGRSS